LRAGNAKMKDRRVMNGSSDDGMEDHRGDGAEEAMMAVESASTTIYRTVLPVICTFGIVGILLTLVVLSRKSMRTSTNCYLMALSVADLAFLILLASLFVHSAAHESATFHVYAVYAAVMTNVSMMASIWLTVLLAVERYIAICRPFLAARVCTVPVAVTAIGLVFVLALASRLPNFWEHRVTWYRDPSDNNRSVAYVEMTELAVDDVYVRVYPWLIDAALASIVPFVALLVLNVSLVREVRRSTRYLQHHIASVSTTTQREELQISVMLISIVVVFFICQVYTRDILVTITKTITKMIFITKISLVYTLAFLCSV